MRGEDGDFSFLCSRMPWSIKETMTAFFKVSHKASQKTEDGYFFSLQITTVHFGGSGG